ncbi:NB-ARC domain-containing protein [Streptomyces sp. NPDC002688]|uniref:NB-ARC domain-containing protein n=1 Tax=Streptomyces sp. NPDC002688 TaxID=3154423 RepID=UPI00332DA533
MRGRAAGMVVLACTGIVLAAALSLAANAATGQDRWPGPLDWLRRYPWPAVGLLLALSVVAIAVMTWRQERPSAGRDDPPPPEPAAVPEWFVARAETRQAVEAVLRDNGSVGITTSLWGAGGFGKTTLATAVCAHRRVRRRFSGRIYTVTIGRDVRGRAAVAAKVAEVTRFITGDTTEFDDPDLAGAHLGRLLNQRPQRMLLVLDDVWEDEQLAPFLHGGRHCARLITTRHPALLPANASRIPVDEMSPDQARALLTWELPPMPAGLLQDLLRTTGRWALLLRLTNRLIAEQTATGADPADAARQALQQLRTQGPTAVDDPSRPWNLDDPRERSRAVRATVEAATTMLPAGGAQRFAELAVFAEDEAVPISLVALLWQATGALTEPQTRSLCRDMERLSLLTLTPDHGGRIGLHDVIRDYLRGDLGDAALAARHGSLVEAVAATLDAAAPRMPSPGHPGPERAWWDLQDGYMQDHLIEHLVAAGRTTQAEAVASDLRWIEARLAQRGPTAPWSDLTHVNTLLTRLLARPLAQAAHLLTPTNPAHARNHVLYSRLQPHRYWRDQVAARTHTTSPRPLLVNRWAPPDIPDPALQRTITGHTDSVETMAVCPDGTWLATGCRDGTVRVWEVASGTCTRTLPDDAGPADSIAISPDGTWLATGYPDGRVSVWEVASGTCTRTFPDSAGRAWTVAISPDGAWLAAGYPDGTVRVWDVARATHARTLFEDIDSVVSLTFSPDGAQLVAVDDYGTACVWDVASGVTRNLNLNGHNDHVLSVAFSADGTWLTTGCEAGVARVWDIATGTLTLTLTGHAEPVYSVAVSPDGTWLATGSRDGAVRIWDTVTGDCTRTLTGHTSPVTTVAISPDATWLASGSSDRTVRIWDQISGAPPVHPLSRAGEVWSLAISPDNAWLATGSRDGAVRVWDIATGTCTRTLTRHTDPVTTMAISPDGTWLATGSNDCTTHLWDVAAGARIRTLARRTNPVTAVTVSPDGTWLATGSNDGIVRLWDAATGTCTRTLTGHASPARLSVAISPDGTWLATTSSDSTVRIWDVATGTGTLTLAGHTDRVRSLAISPDGTRIATGSGDSTVRVWDTATGTCVLTLAGHTDRVLSVAISPDGAWLATTSNDCTVRVWDMTTGSTVTLVRTEHAMVASAWGPDSRSLATGGSRGVFLFELLA